MSAFKYKDEFIVGGGSSEGDGIVELTQAEYDALGPSVETDGKIYLITDGEPEDTLPGNTALLGDTIATVEDASRDADTLEGHNASYFGTAEQISSLNDTITTLKTYSDNETIVGVCNGKPIYRKSYSGTAGTGNTIVTNTLTRANANLINAGGYICDSVGNKAQIGSYLSTNVYSGVFFDEKYARIYHSSGQNGNPYYVWIEYTKTSD